MFLVSYSSHTSPFRYFIGHTKDPDGTAQFVAGQTRVKAAESGAIRIFTTVVSHLT